MAGRNKQKLENIRQDLCKIDSTIKVQSSYIQDGTELSIHKPSILSSHCQDSFVRQTTYGCRSVMYHTIGLQDVPLITADLSDPSSLEHLASTAKCVLATVGPYRLSGTPMVEACVNTGTNYCDITGKPLQAAVSF